MARLSKLVPPKGGRGPWLAYLEDGTLIRVGEGAVVGFALHTGQELDEAALEQLQSAAQEEAMKEKALRCLAARPYSRRELLDKLSGLGEPAQVQAVVGRMEELGYLDDLAYGRQVARRCAEKGYGRQRIRAELYRRGVPREFWEQVLEEAEGPEEVIDRLLEKKMAGREGDPEAQRRAAQAMARRGFSWEEIRAGLRRYQDRIQDG